MELFRKFMIASDHAAEKGHTIFKVFQRFDKELKHKIFRKKDFPAELIEAGKNTS